MGTVIGMNLSAGWRRRPGGRRPLMIKQDAVECVQPVAHYYPACVLNVSRRRRDDSIDLMKVLFIFSQILSPVITEALQHCWQPAPQFVKCPGPQFVFFSHFHVWVHYYYYWRTFID